MSDLRLIIFDVDGTLVDSQGDILAAMAVSFEKASIQMPSREDVLGIVGLSLEQAFEKLVVGASSELITDMTQNYKDAYIDLRAKVGAAQSSPLYPHARQVLDQLQAVDENLLAIATGKSRRGLDKLLDAHDLRGLFISEQVSDFHPSKPHPSMVLQCLADAGVDPHQAVMVGDTTYDMDMGAAACVKTIGVAWGYHDAERLSADRIIHDFRELPTAIEQVLA